MIQHKKAKQALYDKKNRLIVIKKKLDKYTFEISNLNKEKKEQENFLNEIDNKIGGIKSTLKKLEDDDATKIKYNDDGEEKVYEKKPLIVKLFKKEDLLLTEKKYFQKEIRTIGHSGIKQTKRYNNLAKKIYR